MFFANLRQVSILLVISWFVGDLADVSFFDGDFSTFFLRREGITKERLIYFVDRSYVYVELTIYS